MRKRRKISNWVRETFFVQHWFFCGLVDTRAKRLRMRKVSIFQIGGCEGELHNKNACFWAKIELY